MKRPLSLLVALIGLFGCGLLDHDTSAEYDLVDTPRSIAPPAAGFIRLFGSGHVELQREYTGADSANTLVATGRYELRGDTLRVTLGDHLWNNLGRLRGDTIEVSWSGPFDEPHREFYARQ